MALEMRTDTTMLFTGSILAFLSKEIVLDIPPRECSQEHGESSRWFTLAVTIGADRLLEEAPNLMQWTNPTTGIAMLHNVASIRATTWRVVSSKRPKIPSKFDAHIGDDGQGGDVGRRANS